MSVTVAMPTIRSTRYWTRARGFGVFYLVVALIILVGAITRASRMSSQGWVWGSLASAPVRISVPTQLSLIVIGLLMGLAVSIRWYAPRRASRQQPVGFKLCADRVGRPHRRCCRQEHRPGGYDQGQHAVGDAIALGMLAA